MGNASYVISVRQNKFEIGILFTKWPPAAILDDRKSLFIAFFAISDQYTTFFVDISVQYGRQRPFWIPLVMKCTSCSIIFSQNGRRRPFWFFRCSPKSIGFFHSRSSMAVSNMKFDTCIGVTVTWNTSLGVWRLRRRPDQNHNIPEISNFGDIITSIETISLFYQHQYGFRPKHSTIHTVMHLLNQIAEENDKTA